MTELRPLRGRSERVKLSIADFDVLARAGAFDGFAKTELIDGTVIGMNAQHLPHALAKTELAFRLRDALLGPYPQLRVIIEGSVSIEPVNLPEPDIAITDNVRGSGYMTADSIRLVVEIADSTLATDRGRKARLYAAAGFPEYWLLDLRGARLIRMSEPDAGRYRAVTELPVGQAVESLTLPGLVVETAGHCVTLKSGACRDREPLEPA